jgi:RNA polymerase primary sigma factor
MRDTRLGPAARERAREDLIRANLRFAFSIAKKYQHRGLPLEDLVSEANAGLCRAADKYDPDVGVNFISYAVWWIRQAIHAAIAKHARPVRLPLNRATELNRVIKAGALLRDRLRREPTPEEIAHVAEIGADVVQDLLALTRPERSLDEPLAGRRGVRDGETFANVVQPESPDGERTVATALEDESRRNALLRALDILPPRDRLVLRLYYGLETGEPLTLKQIAGRLGVTRERVRQLRDRALAAVRESEAAELLLQEWAA